MHLRLQRLQHGGVDVFLRQLALRRAQRQADAERQQRGEQQDGGPQERGAGGGEAARRPARRAPRLAAAAGAASGAAGLPRRPRRAAGAVEGWPAHPFTFEDNGGHETSTAKTHGITVCAAVHGLRHHRAASADVDRYALPPGCAGIRAPIAADVRARARAAPAWRIACCRRWRPATSTRCATLAHRHGDSYALGIHPLCTRARRATTTWSCSTARWPRTATTRGWWRWARSAWTISCPAWTPARQEHLLPRAAGAGARHGLPVMLHVRRSADRLLKHLRAGRR